MRKGFLHGSKGGGGPGVEEKVSRCHRCCFPLLPVSLHPHLSLSLPLLCIKCFAIPSVHSLVPCVGDKKLARQTLSHRPTLPLSWPGIRALSTTLAWSPPRLATDRPINTRTHTVKPTDPPPLSPQMSTMDLEDADEEMGAKGGGKGAGGKGGGSGPSLSVPRADARFKLGPERRNPVACIVLGMAGSGKTTLMQRINVHIHEKMLPSYVINLDPAVGALPYGCNIDIRDTVNYKEVRDWSQAIAQTLNPEP